MRFGYPIWGEDVVHVIRSVVLLRCCVICRPIAVDHELDEMISVIEESNNELMTVRRLEGAAMAGPVGI